MHCGRVWGVAIIFTSQWGSMTPVSINEEIGRGIVIVVKGREVVRKRLDHIKEVCDKGVRKAIKEERIRTVI